MARSRLNSTWPQDGRGAPPATGYMHSPASSLTTPLWPSVVSARARHHQLPSPSSAETSNAAVKRLPSRNSAARDQCRFSSPNAVRGPRPDRVSLGKLWLLPSRPSWDLLWIWTVLSVSLAHAEPGRNLGAYVPDFRWILWVLFLEIFSYTIRVVILYYQICCLIMYV